MQQSNPFPDIAIMEEQVDSNPFALLAYTAQLIKPFQNTHAVYNCVRICIRHASCIVIRFFNNPTEE